MISKGFLAQSQENTRTDSRTKGQTLFSRTLLTTAEGPTRLTAVDWHLKVKDTEYDDCLIKAYCIKFSMQVGLHKLADVIFGIIQKPIYITSSNLVRYTTNKGIFMNLFHKLKSNWSLIPGHFCL